jgi:hypothetical protein
MAPDGSHPTDNSNNKGITDKIAVEQRVNNGPLSITIGYYRLSSLVIVFLWFSELKGLI